MAELPPDLFEELLKVPAVALSLKNDTPLLADNELCPHCGGVVRSRLRVSKKHLKVVLDWWRSKRERAP